MIKSSYQSIVFQACCGRKNEGMVVESNKEASALRSKILIIIVDEITTTTYYNTTAARCPMQYTRTMHLISQPFHVSNTNSEPAVEDGLAKSSQ